MANDKITGIQINGVYYEVALASGRSSHVCEECHLNAYCDSYNSDTDSDIGYAISELCGCGLTENQIFQIGR